jgi:hypothetical protein
MLAKTENTTDATRGSNLRVRVETRKLELEEALTKLPPDDRSRIEIEHALNELDGLLTGNLDQIPRVVAAELNTWLESNKHVDERHVAKKQRHAARGTAKH